MKQIDQDPREASSGFDPEEFRAIISQNRRTPGQELRDNVENISNFQVNNANSLGRIVVASERTAQWTQGAVMQLLHVRNLLLTIVVLLGIIAWALIVG